MRHYREERISIEYLTSDPLEAQIIINMPYFTWKRNSAYLQETISESLKIFRKMLSLREEINSLESQCMIFDFTKLKKPILDKLNTKICERKTLENMMNKLVHPYYWSGEQDERNKYILYLEQER